MTGPEMPQSAVYAQRRSHSRRNITRTGGRQNPHKCLTGRAAEADHRTFCGQEFPVTFWENIILAGRVRRYSEGLLDRILTEGDYFWKMLPQGMLCFLKYDEIDWDTPPAEEISSEDQEEQTLYRELRRRGASFLKALTNIPVSKDVRSLLMELAQKGLVCADSFIPVRQC